MPHHFTRNTVSVEFYCGKCGKRTQYRIDDGRKGPCLSCIAKLEEKHEHSPPPAAEQQGLFAEKKS